MKKLIQCEVHGEVPPFFICTHLKSAADIAFIGSEEAHCAIPGNEHLVDDLIVCCRLCAQEMGLVPQ